MSLEFLTFFISWVKEPYNFSIITFVIFVIALLIKDRKNIERDFIIFMRRTERGRDFLNNIANKAPKFWRYLGSASVFACFGVMGFGIFMVVRTLYTSLIAQAGPGLSLVIPLPIEEPMLGYGYLGVPLWFWIIPVATVMIVHEGFHGIMMRVNDVKIETLGWVFMAVIPGAFVEPNEESLDKSSWKTKLRVFAAGSTANFILFGTVLLFSTLLFAPTFFSGSIAFTGYVNHTSYNLSEPFPANRLNITPGIVAINGNKINSREEFIDIIGRQSPGEVVDIKTSTGTPGEFNNHEVKLARDPNNKSRPFLGIENPSYNEPGNIRCSLTLPDGLWNNFCSIPKDEYTGYSNILSFIQKLLIYIVVLNLGIGIFNLLPIKPLDGGLMVEAISERFAPNHSKKIVRAATAIMVSIIILSFLAPVL